MCVRALAFSPDSRLQAAAGNFTARIFSLGG
jgi:hypothetical protein